MYFTKLVSVLAVSIVFSTSLSAQEVVAIDSLPKTKDEYVRSEKNVIAVADWLENNPVDQDADKRKLYNAYLVAWITNAPTVTISLNGNIVPMSKSDPDLLFAFMGGWTRYCLQNSYSTDQVQCNLAGLRSVIKEYKANLGHGMKKEKQVEKLIQLEGSSELEKWVTDQLKKK
jgi:hypothetical protein